MPKLSGKDHPGTVRCLAYLNYGGHFGSYQAALSVRNADISLTQATRHTYGFGLNLEQEITRNIGRLFAPGLEQRTEGVNAYRHQLQSVLAHETVRSACRVQSDYGRHVVQVPGPDINLILSSCFDL